MTPVVLVIAGTDSSGGAGLAADLQALRAHGVRARIAVTAVTAQGAQGVRGIWPQTGTAVSDQIAAAGPVDAVKIGMLANREILHAVRLGLEHFHGPIVVDPVLSASAGGGLLAPDAMEELQRLLPRAALVTPNLSEMAALGGESWLQEHPGAVLIKGGHGTGDQLEDRLRGVGPVRTWCHPRLPGEHRGTGCRLASAIAAHLARGCLIPEAVDGGIRWLQTELAGAAGSAAENC